MAAATRCRAVSTASGLSVVNALSEWLRVEIGPRRLESTRRSTSAASRRDRSATSARSGRRGTTTSFLADPEMFETTEYSFDLISQRLRESAYLTKGVWITLVDERTDRERSFYFEGGLQSFVRHLNRNKEVLHAKPIYVERREGRRPRSRSRSSTTTSYTENVLAFANNINTVDGGTHVTGFRAALTSSLNDWARQPASSRMPTRNLSGDDVREGLTAVISVKLTEPQFEGQTKAKLGNAEVEGQVQTAVADSLGQYFDENPADGERLIERCVTTARARKPPRKARDTRHPEERARRDDPARASSPTARNATRRVPGSRPACPAGTSIDAPLRMTRSRPCARPRALARRSGTSR